jgi:hypothetical protein
VTACPNLCRIVLLSDFLKRTTWYSENNRATLMQNVLVAPVERICDETSFLACV